MPSQPQPPGNERENVDIWERQQRAKFLPCIFLRMQKSVIFLCFCRAVSEFKLLKAVQAKC